MNSGSQLVLRCTRAPILRWCFDSPAAVLGRSADCDFVVAHGSVSRRHAKLELVRQELEVTDLSSRNGTYVAGHKIDSRRVGLGQVIRFGQVEFVLDLLDSDAETETEEPGRLQLSEYEAVIAQWPLTRAQKAVFRLVLEGLPEKAIARQLVVSPHTVHTHMRALYRIVGVHSRPELMARVTQSWSVESGEFPSVAQNGPADRARPT